MSGRWSTVLVALAVAATSAAGCGPESPQQDAGDGGAPAVVGEGAASEAATPAPGADTARLGGGLESGGAVVAPSGAAGAQESGAGTGGAGSSAGSGSSATPTTGSGGSATPSPAGTAPAQGGEPAATASSGSRMTDSTAAILRATARRYQDVESMQADFVQVLDNTLLGQTTRSRGTLYQKEPGYFLMRFSDPAGDRIVSDGQYFWLYFPSTDAKQVIRTQRGAQGLDLRAQFIGDPVQRFDATYEGRADVDGRAADVLTLVPRVVSGYERLKVWVDRGDHLIRRFELTEGNGIVRHFDLSNVAVNPSLPDGLFQFTPPAGAQVIDRG